MVKHFSIRKILYFYMKTVPKKKDKKILSWYNFFENSMKAWIYAIPVVIDPFSLFVRLKGIVRSPRSDLFVISADDFCYFVADAAWVFDAGGDRVREQRQKLAHIH